MAFLATGTKTRSAGIASALKKYSALIDLQAATKVTIKFDPFKDSSSNMRILSFYMHRNAVMETNPACRIRTEITVGEPTMEVGLSNGNSLFIKCSNLNPVEVIQLINKHVSSLAPKKVVDETFVKTPIKKKKSSRIP